MNAKDVIRNTIGMSDRILNEYTKDLSDAELLIRPVSGMNHIAWQLGHLLLTERNFIELLEPGASPALPANFEAGHGRDKHGVDDPALFYSAARYRELREAQRGVTLAVLDRLSDDQLNAAPKDERLAGFVGTVGNMLNLIGHHATMHSGQFVAVRRQLGKPVAI